jgi:hypothetical protein
MRDRESSFRHRQGGLDLRRSRSSCGSGGPGSAWFGRTSGRQLSRSMERLYEANRHGQGELLPDFRHEQWASDIAANIRRLLSAVGDFDVKDHIFEVFGEVRGLARDQHVRAAVKKLNENGEIKTSSQGDLLSKRIVATDRPQRLTQRRPGRRRRGVAHPTSDHQAAVLPLWGFGHPTA